MPIFQTSPSQSINLSGHLMTFERPRIMGILNLTPDSFFDGGKYTQLDSAIKRAKQILDEGADIIDIGAYSTRPGAKPIGAAEEIERAVPIIEQIVREYPQAIISIDTFRADVAEACVVAGANIINDVSGGTLDSRMFETVAKLKVPYILMHMRGTPQTMQELTQYDDVVNEVAYFLGERIAQLRELGVKDIILDPGYGFAKTIDQNYDLLLRVNELHYFGLPILGGISRKSMIYKKLHSTADQVLTGTTALNTLLLERGVQILRVHDVKEAKQLVDLFFI
ncbi:dihydropteroate synthase [Sphingobacterium sp. DK4209]|uniref:Dihydropteroate synthase n=1 Tax=Sphingobacterium zhuxiongii TaxID=2662364 RepID=A0A5Q0Q7I8_9SPHI|nr:MULTISPECIES: dihydropteroate synthase [unclassified Sphingobacterium]MVZ64881.1 dihydropteroate synthase [Sphingobacterium sp. DK4209]QGA25224.1 dihydropteroate synthase [Sphingobacterium sp. dk4302]